MTSVIQGLRASGGCHVLEVLPSLCLHPLHEPLAGLAAFSQQNLHMHHPHLLVTPAHTHTERDSTRARNDQSLIIIHACIPKACESGAVEYTVRDEVKWLWLYLRLFLVLK